MPHISRSLANAGDTAYTFQRSIGMVSNLFFLSFKAPGIFSILSPCTEGMGCILASQQAPQN